MAGGSQIIINKDGVTIVTAREFKVYAGQHIFKGGKSVISPTIQLPILGDTNKYGLRYLMKDIDGNAFSNYKYIAFLANGNTVEGCTDDQGYTEFFKTVQPEDVAIHLFKDEQLDVD